jgi:hypothetical protein
MRSTRSTRTALSSRFRILHIRNHGLAGLGLLLLGLLGQRTALAAEDDKYCAFEVVVRTPTGAAASNVPVAVIQKHATMFSEAATDKHGMARLCDAPLEVVDIVVGFDICGSVQVNNLQPTWPESRRVYVTLVDAPCDHFTFPTTCRVLLRIRDEAGAAVSGARFFGETSAGSGQAVSDVLGRLYRAVETGAKLKGDVSKEGYEPAHISVECTSDKELNITLRRPR